MVDDPAIHTDSQLAFVSHKMTRVSLSTTDTSYCKIVFEYNVQSIHHLNDRHFLCFVKIFDSDFNFQQILNKNSELRNYFTDKIQIFRLFNSVIHSESKTTYDLIRAQSMLQALKVLYKALSYHTPTLDFSSLFFKFVKKTRCTSVNFWCNS